MSAEGFVACIDSAILLLLIVWAVIDVYDLRPKKGKKRG